jgi:hypothetical protein
MVTLQVRPSLTDSGIQLRQSNDTISGAIVQLEAYGLRLSQTEIRWFREAHQLGLTAMETAELTMPEPASTKTVLDYWERSGLGPTHEKGRQNIVTDNMCLDALTTAMRSNETGFGAVKEASENLGVSRITMERHLHNAQPGGVIRTANMTHVRDRARGNSAVANELSAIEEAEKLWRSGRQNKA